MIRQALNVMLAAAALAAIALIVYAYPTARAAQANVTIRYDDLNLASAQERAKGPTPARAETH